MKNKKGKTDIFHYDLKVFFKETSSSSKSVYLFTRGCAIYIIILVGLEPFKKFGVGGNGQKVKPWI